MVPLLWYHSFDTGDRLKPILILTTLTCASTPSSKSPVRNPQRPPCPKFRPDLNHVRSPSNFQDIFLIIYLHDFWCPSLQSGTLNILQVPNLGQILIIFIKFSGYLPNHLLTWLMMSERTPSSKFPVKNLQHPSSPKISQSVKSRWNFIKISGYLPDHPPK